MIHAPVYFLEGYIAMEASRFTRVLPVRWPFLAAGFATMIAFSPAKSFALDSSATASTTAPIAYLPETALAYADMPTKAIPMKVPPITGPVPCTDLSGFVATDCVLSRYGITVYGTIDVGGGYQTHGAPWDKYYPTGDAYFIGKMGGHSLWTLAPNAVSQSAIGIRGVEPLGPDLNFVFDLLAGFDPFSLQLANGPESMANNQFVPLNQQTSNGDSSRAGQFYNSVGYLGLSSSTYGTLTVFRQNSLTWDGVLAYDPMNGSNAFSPIGYAGATGGAGDTEMVRYSSSVKYRVDAGPLRAAALWQFGGYDLNNGSQGAYQAQLGGDIRIPNAGLLSLDAIYTHAKDAVSLGLSSAAGSLSAGMPIAPFAQGPLTASISDQTSAMLLAKYVTGPLKLYAGYEWIQFAPPSDPQTSFTNIAGLPMGAAFANDTAINNIAYTATCGTGICSDKIMQVFWAGAKYSIRDNLDLIGAYYHYDQNQFTTASCANPVAHSQCSGTMDAVSALIDWRFAPKWDTYFGIMFSQLNGGLVNGYLAHNNIDPTVGLRFRF